MLVAGCVLVGHRLAQRGGQTQPGGTRAAALSTGGEVPTQGIDFLPVPLAFHNKSSLQFCQL